MDRQNRNRSFFPTLMLLVSVSCTAAAATVGFQPPVSYPVGTRPVAAAVGDFNGDAKLDLAVANAGNPTLADDGNAVAMRISMAGPFAEGADVSSVALFSEKNPVPKMAEFGFPVPPPKVEIESRVHDDPVAGRESLRRLFRGGKIRMEPQPTGKYLARAELMPLQIMLDSVPLGMSSEGYCSSAGSGGAPGALDTAEPFRIRRLLVLAA